MIGLVDRVCTDRGDCVSIVIVRRYDEAIASVPSQ